MAAFPQFDYIFAFGMIFAFLDAWNIGANDVANSFATSVSSRSLTMMQAMAIATVCEFGGAVLAGARVSSTIKNGIISVDDFESNPSVLMLGMACALVGSSIWLTISTKVYQKTLEANIGAKSRIDWSACLYYSLHCRRYHRRWHCRNWGKWCRLVLGRSEPGLCRLVRRPR